MKKIISLLFIAIMSLNAGTVNGGQNDPRLYGKLFFDYTIAGQSFFEYILAGNRKYMILDSRVVSQIKATSDKVNLSVKGRIETPEYMGDSIMVKTLNYYAKLGDKYDSGYIYINGKKIETEQSIHKVQTDKNGNRFLDFSIKGEIRRGDTYVKKLVTALPKFTVTIAPSKKKRGEDFQWETPKFYVIDE